MCESLTKPDSEMTAVDWRIVDDCRAYKAWARNSRLGVSAVIWQSDMGLG